MMCSVVPGSGRQVRSLGPCLISSVFYTLYHNEAERMGVFQSGRPWAPGAPFGHPGGEPRPASLNEEPKATREKGFCFAVADR